jgi:hypothetical protein
MSSLYILMPPLDYQDITQNSPSELQDRTSLCHLKASSFHGLYLCPPPIKICDKFDYVWTLFKIVKSLFPLKTIFVNL